MKLPRKHHGGMETPRKSHMEISMVCHGKHHERTMEVPPMEIPTQVPLKHHGSPHAPRNSHRPPHGSGSPVFPRKSHGGPMEVSVKAALKPHGSLDGNTMEVPWKHHGSPHGKLKHHGGPMAVLRMRRTEAQCFHGDFHGEDRDIVLSWGRWKHSASMGTSMRRMEVECFHGDIRLPWKQCFHRDFHGASVVLPWCSHGDIRASMGICIRLPWKQCFHRDFHGASVVLPWCSHGDIRASMGTSVVLPWDIHGNTVLPWGVPWNVSMGTSVVLPWCFRGEDGSTVLPWGLPWCFHGTAIAH